MIIYITNKAKNQPVTAAVKIKTVFMGTVCDEGKCFMKKQK
jgi:hypothetical protein